MSEEKLCRIFGKRSFRGRGEQLRDSVKGRSGSPEPACVNAQVVEGAGWLTEFLKEEEFGDGGYVKPVPQFQPLLGHWLRGDFVIHLKAGLRAYLPNPHVGKFCAIFEWAREGSDGRTSHTAIVRFENLNLAPHREHPEGQDLAVLIDSDHVIQNREAVPRSPALAL